MSCYWRIESTAIRNHDVASGFGALPHSSAEVASASRTIWRVVCVCNFHHSLALHCSARCCAIIVVHSVKTCCGFAHSLSSERRCRVWAHPNQRATLSPGLLQACRAKHCMSSFSHMLPTASKLPDTSTTARDNKASKCNCCLCRELQSKVKAGEVEPELAMLNAAVVRKHLLGYQSLLQGQQQPVGSYNVSHILQCQPHLQVADLFVVRIAAQQALAQQQRGKLITKSLHAELVYNMSGSRHVSLSSALPPMFSVSSWHSNQPQCGQCRSQRASTGLVFLSLVSTFWWHALMQSQHR